ncbi:MAG TPA: ABC transporter transmembrane domain-containing protein, partial [Candidatus Eisenbacteria bacterium]|nr:ABC transporter transmembrane domain-containing protein [Candidatus Eisenbacteria bacterium]
MKFWAFFRKEFIRYSRFMAAALAVCTTLAALLEGLSFTLFIPLIRLLTGVAGREAEAGGGIAQRALLRLGENASLPVLLGLIVGIFALKNVFLFFQKMIAANIALDRERTLKRDILDSFFSSDWRFYLREKAGTFVNAVGTQARHAADAFKIFSDLILETLNIGAYCLIGLVLAPQAFFLSLAAGGASFFILRGFVGRSRVIGREALEVRNESTTQVLENFTGVKFIKGNHLEESRKKAVYGLLDDLRRVEAKGERFVALMDTLPDFIVALAMCAVILISSRFFKVPGESLLVLIMVLYRFSRRLMAVQNLRQRFYLYLPSLEFCLDLARRGRERREPSGSVRFDGLREGVKLEDVRFEYEEGRPVLRGASLEIPRNRLTAVIGRSGSGKTTLIRRVLQEETTPLRLAVSATTRPPRPGEKDGVDYHFWTEGRF